MSKFAVGQILALDYNSPLGAFLGMELDIKKMVKWQ